MGERTESQICSIKRLITKFTDGKSGETTDYVYDCHGNTMSVLVSSESGTLLKQLTGDVEKITTIIHTRKSKALQSKGNAAPPPTSTQKNLSLNL